MNNTEQQCDGGDLKGDDANRPGRTRYAAVPHFDAAKYWTYLEDLEGTDAEKTAMLEALWSLMARFVELGFGVDPVQTVIPALVESSLAADDQDDHTAAKRRFNQTAKSNRKGDGQS